jgi:hypothetical protein
MHSARSPLHSTTLGARRHELFQARSGLPREGQLRRSIIVRSASGPAVLRLGAQIAREMIGHATVGRGGRGAVVQPSSVIGLRGSRAPSWHTLHGWSSGRGHSSVRARCVRPPQVGVRRGPGASISEAAWSPIERARPVTAEGLSMSPLPRVPAGRFRRSGTRDLAEAAERLFCGPWSRGNPGRRSDAGRGASGGAGVKAGESPRQRRQRP